MVPPVESSEPRHGTTRVTGVVVAGGASSRFGGDKANALFEGETLAARALRTLAATVAEVVVADAGRRVVAGARAVADGPGRGPAAAILGAAGALPGRSLLVLACDLPRVPAALLALLLARGGDWVVPRLASGLEPLCALYRPAALEALAARVERGDYALHRLAETAGLEVAYLDAGELAHLGEPAALFANVNTRDDLERIASAR